MAEEEELHLMRPWLTYYTQRTLTDGNWVELTGYLGGNPWVLGPADRELTQGTSARHAPSVCGHCDFLVECLVWLLHHTRISLGSLTSRHQENQSTVPREDKKECISQSGPRGMANKKVLPGCSRPCLLSTVAEFCSPYPSVKEI